MVFGLLSSTSTYWSTRPNKYGIPAPHALTRAHLIRNRKPNTQGLLPWRKDRGMCASQQAIYTLYSSAYRSWVRRYHLLNLILWVACFLGSLFLTTATEKRAAVRMCLAWNEDKLLIYILYQPDVYVRACSSLDLVDRFESRKLIWRMSARVIYNARSIKASRRLHCSWWNALINVDCEIHWHRFNRGSRW